MENKEKLLKERSDLISDKEILDNSVAIVYAETPYEIKYKPLKQHYEYGERIQEYIESRIKQIDEELGI